MVKITEVEQGSLADRHGIVAGDVLISINGNEINDVLDYRFYLTDRTVNFKLLRQDGEYSVSFSKGEYQDVGLGFETPLMDKKHSCKNGCIFCFIDQNPEGLRDSLYFKDDDSRLSFIHGNYITLTNMTDKDVERIVKMRFSPINISIHTTNPELRVMMMKNKNAGDVLRYLKVFKDAGLNMCGQIVLCKGVNDGEELLSSMKELSRYYPELSSVSIVPAGLTKFRDKLYPLTDFSREEAQAVIETVEAFAKKHKEQHGSRLFFLADEFYLKAGQAIPDADYYEEYPQIENGVGMLRSLSDELSFGLEDAREHAKKLEAPRRVAIATGVAAYPLISSLAESLTELSPLIEVKAYEIKNHFFGETITVSGLLTGKDIFEQLSGKIDCDELLISRQSLRACEDVFLCGMTLSELSEKLDVKIRVCANDGFELIDAIFGI